eukprot:COSAG03_NODE_4155_length_1660_cov_5.919283_2_plen_119_part_00
MEKGTRGDVGTFVEVTSEQVELGKKDREKHACTHTDTDTDTQTHTERERERERERARQRERDRKESKSERETSEQVELLFDDRNGVTIHWVGKLHVQHFPVPAAACAVTIAAPGNNYM